jgi:hypothetical protein
LYCGNLRTFPVFLAVPEKTRIIGAVIAVLPEELNPSLLPGPARLELRPNKTNRRSGKNSVPLETPILLVRGPIAQRLEQGTHNPLVVGSNPTGPKRVTKDGTTPRSYR